MTVLAEIVARNRAGAAVGLPSWCTAHPETLAAILARYRDDTAPVLIEATCNQVNQFGGYTGMTPADYCRFVTAIATAQRVDPARLILGGDHLGPNPWRHEPAAVAMDKARAMVSAYVAAGFSKIHLDASMRCADDFDLTEAAMAARAADLCAVAEAAAKGRPLAYVIGTEVPVPGGETGALDGLAVTTPKAARHTLDLHRAAFAARGVQGALDRVVALVVQPGVDFGNDQVFAYDPARAAPLVAAATGLGGPLFEAHSTDYQSPAALRALVEGHFAILKVGPELTFGFRQAVLALAQLETGMDLAQPSGIVAVLVAAMRADPADWRGHIAPGPREAALLLYGLSDRIRYYWPRDAVRGALARLMQNIRNARPEPGLVAQVTGGLIEPIAAATLPEQMIARMVGAVVDKYRNATGA